jgi:hypothetical protein
MSKLVPVSVAARESKISPERVRRLYHTGGLPGEVIAGRILVDPSQIPAALDAAHAARGAGDPKEAP